MEFSFFFGYISSQAYGVRVPKRTSEFSILHGMQTYSRTHNLVPSKCRRLPLWSYSGRYVKHFGYRLKMRHV
jgi:hypothetical protein